MVSGIFDDELVDPGSILGRLAGHQEFMEVPKRWESNSKNLDGGFGHATYVLN